MPEVPGELSFFAKRKHWQQRRNKAMGPRVVRFYSSNLSLFNLTNFRLHNLQPLGQGPLESLSWLKKCPFTFRAECIIVRSKLTRLLKASVRLVSFLGGTFFLPIFACNVQVSVLDVLRTTYHFICVKHSSELGEQAQRSWP